MRLKLIPIDNKCYLINTVTGYTVSNFTTSKEGVEVMKIIINRVNICDKLIGELKWVDKVMNEEGEILPNHWKEIKAIIKDINLI